MVPMSRAWAVIRVGLGLAQTMGATVALFLPLTMGVTSLTVRATAVALFLTILSKLIFGKMDRKHAP